MFAPTRSHKHCGTLPFFILPTRAEVKGGRHVFQQNNRYKELYADKKNIPHDFNKKQPQ
jgi:hypothetical protein